MTEGERICNCGRPTRDGAYFCDDCAKKLAIALGEVPWLEEELETAITRVKGVDYRTKGGTASSERPSPVAWNVSEARGHLRATMVAWVRFCHEEGVRNSSPIPGIPEDTLTAMSRFLLWRVDGLSLLDIGPEAVEEITDAAAKCHRLIDSPVPKQYLGPCDLEGCKGGRLYARPGSRWAACDTCDGGVDAEEKRADLLKSLDDRLCTAAEIARLSTYLGLKANRDQVRQRINTWHSRGRIMPEASISDEVTFRFGEVYDRLVKDEYTAGKAS